jgi:hypothetical protein
MMGGGDMSLHADKMLEEGDLIQLLLMLYKVKVTVFSKIHTKHINVM